MAKFNVGDIVVLNSDSIDTPQMTVEGYFADEAQANDAVRYFNYNPALVKCTWRTTDGTPFTKYFEEDALRLV